MSADFWAGYISGAAGILIGNPLDVVKVRLQASSSTTITIPLPAAATATAAPSQQQRRPWTTRIRALTSGTAAPVLGYGALNALLFVSYNRAEALLNSFVSSGGGTGAGGGTGSNLWTTWIAGAVGGLATWAVSTPTELVKCRAQLSSSSSPSAATATAAVTGPPLSSWAVAKRVWRADGGIRGFYLGGAVTALRDSVGYGFYFWSYELCGRWMRRWREDGGGGGGGGGGRGGQGDDGGGVLGGEAARVLLCGGVAGVVTWASIFPLDTIKTRVQAQQVGTAAGVASERSPLLGDPVDARPRRRLGAVEEIGRAHV